MEKVSGLLVFVMVFRCEHHENAKEIEKVPKAEIDKKSTSANESP